MRKKSQTQVTEQVTEQVEVQVTEQVEVEITIEERIAKLVEAAIDELHIQTCHHPGLSITENITKNNNRAKKAKIIYKLLNEINEIKKQYEQ